MKNKICYFLIILGIITSTYKIINKRITIITEENNIEYSIGNIVGYLYEEKKELYYMVIEIPKINLKKGIYNINNPKNNINQNITINNKSKYPDIDNSNLILMAHSGEGEKAFFKKLYRLDTDSLVKIYYNNKIYTYKIENIYDVLKIGEVNIIRNKNKKTITLITCNQKDKQKQTIYIGYLIDEV